MRTKRRGGHPRPDPTELEEMDGGKLYVPRSAVEKPRREFLEARYEAFRKAG